MLNFIKNSYGDLYLHEVNGSKLNKFGAKKTFSEHYKSSLFNEDSIYIIVGTDSGLLPKYILEQGVPSGTEYIFVETDLLYPIIINQFPGHRQLHLSTRISWEGVAIKHDIKLHIQAFLANFIYSISSTSGYHSEYVDLINETKRTFEQLSRSVLRDSQLVPFFRAGLFNLADNKDSVRSTISPSNKSTAIILGAGPSLDQHIEWIRGNQDCLYIFAVSRLSKKLLDEKIIPDYIVTVDPEDNSYTVGKESFEFEKKSTLINSFHGNPQIVGQWIGNKIFTGIRYPWKTKYNKDCTQQSGTTVSNIAYDAARHIGFKRILLAGVDFCYDSKGFTHATGSATDAIRAPETSRSELFVLNNRGEKSETNYEFYDAGKELSNIAKQASIEGTQTINLSSSAMALDHIEFMSTSKVILNKSEKTPLTINKKNSESYYSECLKELSRVRKELNILDSLAKDGINKNKSLFDKHGNKNLKAERQLEKINDKINNNNNPLVALIKLLSIRHALHYLKATRKEQTKWTISEIVDSSIGYLNTYRANISNLLKVINDSSKRIQNRQTETKQHPTPSLEVIQQWIQDKQPRRRHIFNIDIDNTTENSELHSKIVELYNIEKELNSPPKEDKEIEKKFRDSFPNIISLSAQNDLEGLNLLLEKLENQPDLPLKSIYINLCNGVIENIKKNQVISFSLFTSLLEENSQLSEEEIEFILSKVTVIAIELKDYANAIVSLETLSDTFSSHYTPKYAQLLYLTGDTEKSLQIFENYISCHPDDLDAIFSLAELQRNEGNLESSEYLYQYILSKSPGYTPAIQRLENLNK